MNEAMPRLRLRDFIHFAAVGTIGTVVQYVVLITLVEGAGVGSVVGSVTGYLAGAIVNYYLNY